MQLAAAALASNPLLVVRITDDEMWQADGMFHPGDELLPNGECPYRRANLQGLRADLRPRLILRDCQHGDWEGTVRSKRMPTRGVLGCSSGGGGGGKWEEEEVEEGGGVGDLVGKSWMMW